MCSRLEQEYRIWLEEVLEVLHELCEDVVPAGRVDENIYSKTKALYSASQFQRQDDFNVELLHYAEEGRAKLEAVKSALAATECKNEETVIRLRRVFAASILNSLQYLVNFAFLGEADLKIGEELSQYFEIDSSDRVKRIRSGVMVTGNVQQAQVKQYRARVQKQEDWTHPVAG